MKHVEGSFRGVRNANLYFQAWLPEEEAKAALLIVHGLGSHSGRWASFAGRFVRIGYAVYGLDHLGHGKSDGAREYVERFEDFADPLTEYRRRIREGQAGKPVFLLGHSMGGLIAAFHLLDHQADYRGAILSAPAVRASLGVPPAVIAAGQIFVALVPRLGTMRVDEDALSHNPDAVKAYRDDPLVHHGRTSLRLMASLYYASLRVLAEARRITLPLLALQGTADRLVHPASARLLHDLAGSTDKTLIEYEGLFHEIFNEPERERVLGDVEAWLAARV
jgi:alpha-beta hydrolase superfamily lysophospholipase